MTQLNTIIICRLLCRAICRENIGIKDFLPTLKQLSHVNFCIIAKINRYTSSAASFHRSLIWDFIESLWQAWKGSEFVCPTCCFVYFLSVSLFDCWTPLDSVIQSIIQIVLKEVCLVSLVLTFPKDPSSWDKLPLLIGNCYIWSGFLLHFYTNVLQNYATSILLENMHVRLDWSLECDDILFFRFTPIVYIFFYHLYCCYETGVKILFWICWFICILRNWPLTSCSAVN